MENLYLLSSGRSTIVSEFGSLETKDVYEHENSDTTDFQFFPRQLLFAQLNKKDRVEILRIKETNKDLKIQRLKRIDCDNAVCLACPKFSQTEIAFGLRNGKIKLYDHMRSKVIHQFSGDTTKTCVTHLDYNSSDEYLSAVFDNGSISIYGVRTKVKMESFRIDGVSTMTRFHPIKRHVLSIASHKGNVTLYNINTWQKIAHHTDVHTAPCRDLCMSPSRADTLISVGFDCRVNIFDIRRKLPVTEFQQSHPLSAGAISGCGNYFCIGNLKGELITYDIRNLKEKRFLTRNKVHDGQVARITFFTPGEQKVDSPNRLNQIIQSTSANSNQSSTKEGNPEHCKSSINNDSEDMIFRRRDSFNDFLECHQQSNLIPERHSISFVTERNSYDCWDALVNKPNLSKRHITSRLSLSANSPSQSFEEGLKSGKVDIIGEPVVVAPPVPVPRDRSKLRQIKEERRSSENISSGSDKENSHIDLEMSKRLRQLTADRNSTPKLANSQRSGESITSSTITATGAGANIDILQWRAEINSRLDKLESNLKFEIETNKWQIYTQNFNLWSKLNENNEAMCEALGVLLETDPFVNEFWRLKKENEMLKNELQKLTKK